MFTPTILPARLRVVISHLAEMNSSKNQTLKICHLADVHLGFRKYNRLSKEGVNQRELDVALAFDEALERVVQIKPNLILIAGDLFHTVRPSNAVIASAFKRLSCLVKETKAPCVIVAGNHESPKRSDTGSILALFREINGVFVSDKKTTRFDFGDLKTSVFCVPHSSLVSGLEQEIRANDQMKFNILMMHGQFGPYMTDFGGVVIDLEEFSPREWDYIALGHLHNHSEVAFNACYPGSIEHTSTNIWEGSGSQKGFLEIDLPEGKRQFHALTSPRDVFDLGRLDVSDLNAVAVMEALRKTLESIPEGIDGKIVRLRVQGLDKQTYRNLDHQQIKIWRQMALHLSLEFKLAYLDFDMSGKVLEREAMRSLEKEFQEYLIRVDMAEEKRNKIHSLVIESMQKVQEKQESALGEPTA